mmetsp:Transcript_98297/g.283660  ORF Transcript_98297/g.283660 Transcript_98297/m.283660 type:complete len:461 (+) Transcript_98297:65-1447(+)
MVAEDAPPSCFPGHLALGRPLGKGTYGAVYLCDDRCSGKQVAVKHIKNPANCRKCIVREIVLLARLRHDNLVYLLDFVSVPSPDFKEVLLVMPFLPSNLHKVIRSKEDISERHAQAIICQILRGLAYLHAAGVAHRDLKPENIMASDCGRHLKIIDFGMAVESTAQCSSVVGTFPFVAPEVLELLSEQAGNETYAPCPVDIWALGVIMIELLAGVNRMKTLMGWESNVGPTVESRRDVEALFGVQGALERQWNERIGRELEPDALWLLEGMLAVKSHLRSTVGVVEASMWLSPASDQADAAAAIDVPDAQRAPSVSDKTVRAPLTPSPPAGVPTVSHRRRRHHVAGAAPANSEDRSSSPGTARGDIEGSGSTEALASAEALVGDPSASSPFISGDLDDRSRATARPPSAPSGHGRRPRRLVSVSERKSDRGASPGPPPACGVVGNISASAEATLAGLHPQ